MDVGIVTLLSLSIFEMCFEFEVCVCIETMCFRKSSKGLRLHLMHVYRSETTSLKVSRPAHDLMIHDISGRIQRRCIICIAYLLEVSIHGDEVFTERV